MGQMSQAAHCACVTVFATIGLDSSRRSHDRVSPQGHHSNDVSRIYRAALELPESDRLAHVRRECAGDDALRREVESLLAWDADVAPLERAVFRPP